MNLHSSRFLGLGILLLTCSRGTTGASMAHPGQNADSCSTVPHDWRPSMLGPWNEPGDSSRIVTKPSQPRTRYIRDRFDIAFEDSLTGPQACLLLAKHRARVIGAFRDVHGAGVYTIAVPDPGTSWSAWEALFNSLRAEAGFRIVYGLPCGEMLRPPREPA